MGQLLSLGLMAWLKNDVVALKVQDLPPKQLGCAVRRRGTNSDPLKNEGLGDRVLEVGGWRVGLRQGQVVYETVLVFKT